jgi:hypothetical protein
MIMILSVEGGFGKTSATKFWFPTDASGACRQDFPDIAAMPAWKSRCPHTVRARLLRNKSVV